MFAISRYFFFQFFNFTKNHLFKISRIFFSIFQFHEIFFYSMIKTPESLQMEEDEAMEEETDEISPGNIQFHGKKKF